MAEPRSTDSVIASGPNIVFSVDCIAMFLASNIHEIKYHLLHHALFLTCEVGMYEVQSNISKLTDHGTDYKWSI